MDKGFQSHGGSSIPSLHSDACPQEKPQKSRFYWHLLALEKFTLPRSIPARCVWNHKNCTSSPRFELVLGPPHDKQRPSRSRDIRGQGIFSGRFPRGRKSPGASSLQVKTAIQSGLPAPKLLGLLDNLLGFASILLRRLIG